MDMQTNSASNQGEEVGSKFIVKTQAGGEIINSTDVVWDGLEYKNKKELEKKFRSF